MFIVVSYDVTDDRRRTRVMKTLKNFGTRVQYSVFECELKPEVCKRMRAQIEKLIAPKEDNVRFYFFDEDAIGKIETIGVGGQVQRAKDFYIIGAG
jgi:CRISPR-associated protein Cas2